MFGGTFFGVSVEPVGISGVERGLKRSQRGNADAFCGRSVRRTGNDPDLEGMIRGRTGPYLCLQVPHAGLAAARYESEALLRLVRFRRLNSAQLEAALDGQVTRPM